VNFSSHVKQSPFSLSICIFALVILLTLLALKGWEKGLTEGVGNKGGNVFGPVVWVVVAVKG